MEIMKALRFSKFKIQDKIAWLSIIQFVIVFVFVGLILNLFVSRLVNQDLKNNLLTVADSRASHLETYFNGNIQSLQLVTSRTALRKALAHYNETGDEKDLVTITSIIKDVISATPKIERICILGLSGRALVSTDEKYCGNNVVDANYFINGLKKEGIYFVEEEGVNKMYISGPIRLDNQLLGVGMTVLNLNDVVGILQEEIRLGKTAEVLAAYYNEVGQRKYLMKRMFESEAIPTNIENDKTAYPIKQALAGREVYFENTLDYRNKEVVATSAFIKVANLGLVVKIDRYEVLGVNRQLFLLFLLFFVISSLIYYILSQQVARFISKPIVELNLGVKEIEKGNLDYKVGTLVQDEIGQLSRSFDDVVKSIKKSKIEVDQKVKEQTKELIERQKATLDQQKAILNILEDVESEKNKTEVLAKDLEKFKLAVDNASDHIVITNADGVVVYANKGVERITGYSPKEVLGKKSGSKETWGGLMSVEFYRTMWDTIKNKKKVYIGELKNRRKNGEEYEVAATISPILNSGGEVIFFIGIERDITKEKQIDRAKTEFVSLASHQLRTPLSAINWYTEMLLNGDAGKINSEQKQYLDEVYKGNQRMVQLVNSLLNVSRLELGTFIVEPELIDLPVLAGEVVKEMIPQITTKKLKVKENYDKKLDKYSADPKLMKIILQNLLSNAVKYTPENGAIEISITKDNKSVLLTVKDSGYGITKTQQDKIFTKLFRADNVREKDTEGTGLGLYLVKSIIDSSSGKIWFESVEDKGSTFYVSLPLSGMKKKEGTKSIS